MKSVFALLLVILLAFSGYHLTFRGVRFRAPRFTRVFYLTGAEFLLLGLLLSPALLNILDEPTRQRLAPLSTMALGWVGMLYGFQFDLKRLRRFPPARTAVALLESVFTMALALPLALWHLPSLFPESASLLIPLSLLMATAAACSGQTGLALLAAEKGAEADDGRIDLLRYLASLDGLPALLVFGLAFSFRPGPEGGAWVAAPAGAIAMSLGAGMGLLVLFWLFVNQNMDESELALVVIGMILMASGVAAMVGFSPLLTNVFVGLCLVNMTRRGERIYRILAIVEKPAYLVLLVFLGALWQPAPAAVWIGAAAFLTVRTAAKAAAVPLALRLVPAAGRYPAFLGLGLVEQGGLSLALLLDFSHRFPEAIVAGVVSAVLGATLLSELIGLRLQRVAAGRAGRPDAADPVDMVDSVDSVDSVDAMDAMDAKDADVP